MDAFTTCLWFDTEGEEAARFYAGDLSELEHWQGDAVPRRGAGGSDDDCRLRVEREQVRRP